MFIEVDEDFPDHPKTRHFCRLIQNRQGWSWVILLWRWCTKYAKDGDLSGYSPEDIEFNLDWNLGEGKLWAAFQAAGFIDDDGKVHDWDKHQGKWIKRLEADRAAARARREGRRRADIETPSPTLHELAELDKQVDLPNVDRPSDDVVTTDDGRTPNVVDSLAKQSIAKPDTPKPPPGVGYSAEFEAFWAEYPRKTAKGNAWRAWRNHRPPVDAVLAAIRVQRESHDWRKEGGAYVPYPATWLNGRRWEDGPPQSTQTQPSQYRTLG